jgi:septum formation inhibitor MinC
MSEGLGAVASGDVGAADAAAIGNDLASQAQPGETPAQTAARLFKVKVDGQEMEVDEGELIRGYAHNKAAAERLRQASETRQLAEEVLSIFKNNPREAFNRLGVDAKAFAEQVLQAEMEDAMLTPEQKELRELKAFKEQMAAKEAAAREEQERAAEAAFREQVAAELQTNIINTLEMADLPKNEFTIGRMAYYLESCLQAGYNATPQDVIAHVKSEYDRELKSFLGSITDDKLLNFMGDDFTNRVVKAHIGKTKAKVKQPSPAVVGAKIDKPADSEPKTPRDFFRRR